jgi:hypothetical protein
MLKFPFLRFSPFFGIVLLFVDLMFKKLIALMFRLEEHFLTNFFNISH